MFTEGEEHFVRIFMLLVDVCPRAIRNQFNKDFHPGALKGVIRKSHTLLSDLHKRRIISQPQWQTLNQNNLNPSSESFDISLMTLLLHHLAGFNISERLPLKTDTSVEADISRIKIYRNTYFHSAWIEIGRDEYTTAWSDLCEAITRLGGENLQNDCEKWEFASLDNSLKNSILEILREDVKRLQHAQSELYRLNPNIRGRQNVLPETKRITTEKNNELFIKTNVISDGIRVLEENGLVLLTGKVGIGKSTNALEIIRDYCHRHQEYDIQRLPYTFEECKLNIWENEMSFVNPRMPLDVIKGANKVVLLVDDVLHTDAALPVNVVIQILEFIQRLVQNGCTKAVCVITELDKRNTIFNNMSILDLDSNKYKLKQSEKEKLLRTYIDAMSTPSNERLNDTQIKDIAAIDDNSTMGFPELCILFTNVSTLYSNGSDFFHSPCKFILEDLRNMKRQSEKFSKIHYLLFLFLMMERRLVSKSDIKKHVFSTSDTNELYKEVNVIEVLNEFKKMKKRNAYLRERSVVDFSSACPFKMYGIRNSVIFDLFVHAFFESDVLSSIDSLDIGFIATELKPFAVPHSFAKPGLVVNSDLYDQLAVRIITCLQNTLPEEKAIYIRMHMIAYSNLLDDVDFLNNLLDKSRTFYMCSDVFIPLTGRSVLFFLPATLLQFISNKPNEKTLVCTLLRHIDFSLSQTTISDKIKEACHKTIVYTLCKRCAWDDKDVLDGLLTVIEKHQIQVEYDDYECLFQTAFQNKNEKTMKWVIAKFGDRIKKYVHLFVINKIFGKLGIHRNRFEWLVNVIGIQYFNIYGIMEYLAGNKADKYADELIYVWQKQENEESIIRDQSEIENVINSLMKVACDSGSKRVVSRLYEYFKDRVVRFDNERKIFELL
ncbi:uncharacterized protein [Mytilus edulis]|uniref:uncharacterized protein n=1 Tax=Mytilus edulis TaxID=6550 RepID=UPI0039F14573